jgi:hypothetical protein
MMSNCHDGYVASFCCLLMNGPNGSIWWCEKYFLWGDKWWILIQVMDFNQLDLFVWLALWSLSLWLNTSMHPLKNPGVLRNCQDLYLIFPFPFLWVWCTVNFEPVYVNVNSSFAEGLLGRWANRVEIFAYKIWIYTGITNGLWKRFDL